MEFSSVSYSDGQNLDFYSSGRIKNGVCEIFDCFVFGNNSLEYPLRGSWLYHWRTCSEHNHKGVKTCGLP